MLGDPLAAVVAARALDGLAMRMAAIAQNIANANSARFQPLSVRFEERLARAAHQGSAATESVDFAFEAGRRYLPGEDRRLDLMIADAAQTAMRYSALVDMLGRRLALQRAVAGAQG